MSCTTPALSEPTADKTISCDIILNYFRALGRLAENRRAGIVISPVPAGIGVLQAQAVNSNIAGLFVARGYRGQGQPRRAGDAVRQ